MSLSEVAVATELAIAPQPLWESVCRLEGVNRELSPWLRMTAPPGLEGATIADLEPGKPAGRCRLLLFGLLPIDYDDLTIAEVDPPHRFLERSRMLTIDPWEHERTIRSVSAATSVLTDRLRFRLRLPLRAIPGSDRLAAAVVRVIFRHRHRRLAKLYGVPTDR
ncbi:MAG: hypothetical protein R2718_02400 [Solirubrobacterales bacterium]